MKTITIPAEPGRYIADLERRLKRLSIPHKVLAREMGIKHPSQVVRWFTARATPRPATILRIERAVAAIEKRQAKITRPRK